MRDPGDEGGAVNRACARPGCRWSAWGESELCLAHGSAAGDPAAIIEQRARGLRSNQVQEQRRAAERAPEPPPPELPGNVIAWDSKYVRPDGPAVWRATLKASYGLPLDAADLLAFAEVCGHSSPNPAGYSEVEIIAGRRSGKSEKGGATISLFEAIVRGPEHMRYLAPGQRGYVVVISRTQRQALETFRYARAVVERSPELAALLDGPPLESLAGGELRFKNGAVFTVMPASKASVRGFTILAAILDEFAWIATDEQAANQDEEIAAAVRYGMVAPVGAPVRRLFVISSPSVRAGLLYESYALHYGKPDAPVLVAHGPTWVWNPSIDRDRLERERQRDPKRYAREVLAEFTDAISAWIDGAVVDEAATGRDALPLPPRRGVNYRATVDMAFKRDAAVLTIGHVERPDGDPERAVVDVIERVAPQPDAALDAPALVRRFAEVCRAYGVREVIGDQFCIVPLSAEFRRHGIELREETATNSSKLANYSRLREALYARRISLPRHDVALAELRQLEERVTSSGNVQIGAPNRAGAHDDCAAALAWLCSALPFYPTRGRTTMEKWADADIDGCLEALGTHW